MENNFALADCIMKAAVRFLFTCIAGFYAHLMRHAYDSIKKLLIHFYRVNSAGDLDSVKMGMLLASENAEKEFFATHAFSSPGDHHIDVFFIRSSARHFCTP